MYTAREGEHNIYANPNDTAKRQELLERMVVAMEHPRRVPQYGNMPLLDGKRILINAEHLLGGLTIDDGS